MSTGAVEGGVRGGLGPLRVISCGGEFWRANGSERTPWPGITRSKGVLFSPPHMARPAGGHLTAGSQERFPLQFLVQQAGIGFWAGRSWPTWSIRAVYLSLLSSFSSSARIPALSCIGATTRSEGRLGTVLALPEKAPGGSEVCSPARRAISRQQPNPQELEVVLRRGRA